MRLEGVQVPLGVKNSTTSGRVSFETITIQSKRVGGLRIGVLPELRIEDMNLRLASDADSVEWAEELHRLLKREPLLQSATIERLSISQPDGSPIVEAGRAGLSRDATRLELKNVRIAGASKKIPSAQLVLAGRNAGSVLIGSKRQPLPLTNSTLLGK